MVRKPSSVSNGSGNEIYENETRLHEHQLKPEQELGQSGMQIKVLELEKELLLSGLPIERLGNDHLKVNLSSEGLFDFDSALIKDNARPALEKLADVFRNHDDLPIQIVGHADSSGVAEFNQLLAQLRAKAVKEYLVNQGLGDPGIQSEGRGDQDTSLEQSTSNNPRLKRRVEIYIRRTQGN